MYGLLQKFDRFDYDGDGYLTRGELKEGVRESSSLQLSDAELDQVMRAYDANRDRRISHHEAQQAAQRGPGIFDAR